MLDRLHENPGLQAGMIDFASDCKAYLYAVRIKTDSHHMVKPVSLPGQFDGSALGLPVQAALSDHSGL